MLKFACLSSKIKAILTISYNFVRVYQVASIVNMYFLLVRMLMLTLSANCLYDCDGKTY
jgi:hypothetical protein